MNKQLIIIFGALLACCLDCFCEQANGVQHLEAAPPAGFVMNLSITNQSSLTNGSCWALVQIKNETTNVVTFIEDRGKSDFQFVLRDQLGTQPQYTAKGQAAFVGNGRISYSSRTLNPGGSALYTFNLSELFVLFTNNTYSAQTIRAVPSPTPMLNPPNKMISNKVEFHFFR